MAAKVDKKGEGAKKPFQQGVEDGQLDYYDIMVIGRTGMGKSTTVDKLLIAKLPGMAAAQQPAATELQGQDWQEAVPVQSPDGRKLQCSDMIMWLISDEQFEEDRVSIRLKNLVFFRSVENSHKEINKSRESGMHIYESTTKCELLSNETTRVRILDVPGFFGRDAAGEVCDLHERVQAGHDTDLSTMRKVLRIKSVHCLNFNRVIYFLPDKGSLKRTSHNLILEIGIMEKYFGRAIFDNMVVVATQPSDLYEAITDESYDMFSNPSRYAETKLHLQEAIKVIFRGPEEVPEPPLIFISLFDTCEGVLRKVQGAKVKQERIQLELSRSVCSRCGAKIFKEGKDDAEAAYCTSVDQPGWIAQEESTCHPMLVPKFSQVAKVLGGIAHLVTLRRFVGRWPNFESMDEECIGCRKPPSSRGCVQVGSKFPLCKGKIELEVHHSTSAFEPYQIEVEEDDGTPVRLPGDVVVGSGAPVATAPNRSICNQRGNNHYVYQDGRMLFRQELSPHDFCSSDIKGT